MSDVTGVRSTASCNDRCGCPSPCPGGTTCRCGTQEGAAGVDHKKCSCGNHCGCNPCSCASAVAAEGTGKFYCRCGPGCTCTSCAA